MWGIPAEGQRRRTSPPLPVRVGTTVYSRSRGWADHRANRICDFSSFASDRAEVDGRCDHRDGDEQANSSYFLFEAESSKHNWVLEIGESSGEATPTRRRGPSCWVIALSRPVCENDQAGSTDF